MRYSIIIPAFNKAQLTRNCLLALYQTTGGLPDGEVLVVDNASADETPEMLTEFPWVRVIRNERNIGFAAANNQAAAMAAGEYLILLNNDTQPLDGWLNALLAAAAPEVGAVGARLLFPDGTLQHGGVVAVPSSFGITAFTMVHDLYGIRGDDARALQKKDCQAVTGACLLTPRNLYLELGGLDELYWNGNEDVDYCLRVRERGLRVVYEPAAKLLHFESRSGVQRFRRAPANAALLAQRWNDRVEADQNVAAVRRGELRRPVRAGRGAFYWESVTIPRVSVLVYGVNDSLKSNVERMVASNAAPLHEICFCEDANAIAAAREMMENRGDRYVAIVDARAQLANGWLDELLRQIEWDPRVAAAKSSAEGASCTLLAMRKFPAHHRLRELGSLPEAVNDFIERAAREFGTGVRPALQSERMEQLLRSRKPPERGLVSIVTLSWNAPQFTKLALESIRAHTTPPYEIIIVDNGSEEETTSWLRTLEDVRVIFNKENRGYAVGNNQGFAAAQGDFVVMLNNDVIVTEGWLDGLLEPFNRIGGLGVTAPRSNKVAGDQQLSDCNYGDTDSMHRYAAQRRQRLRSSGYLTDRAIGLCLCIDRRVIDEVGGIDPSFGLGNFEDDDFCMRVRGAGYKIYVCDDVFIHHFGSQTFAANNVDWTATMQQNAHKFAQKWGYGDSLLSGGYDARIAIRKGYDRALHYVALPPAQSPAVEDQSQYRNVLVATVADEGDWNEVGALVRKYATALRASDGTLFAIAATGELPAAVLGTRINRAISNVGVAAQNVADIEVSDEADVHAWLASLPTCAQWNAGGRALREHAGLRALPDRSPSGLQRVLRNAQALPA